MDGAMEIMKLVLTGKDYLWGGTRLREEYGKKIDLLPLEGTWECSVYPDGPCYIANGEFKGLALADRCIKTASRIYRNKSGRWKTAGDGEVC